jgi:hypothetical protein
MPVMVNLNSTEVSWKDRPSSDWFWKYTNELDSRYNDSEDAYILWVWEEVMWLQSSVWYAYGLTQNDVEEYWNIGLLVYTIITHNILSDWTVTDDSEEHKECVLFKSWENEWETPPIDPVEPPVVPETWPEHILLVVLALILGFWFFILKKNA